MHEATHISYGDGIVNIVLDSSSQTEVSAPGFRFADYNKLITSSFTKKELERIDDGEIAEITFYFVVSDDIDDAEVMRQYEVAVEENENDYGNLSEGFYLDIRAFKKISDDEQEVINTLSDEVDIQMDIPLYLVKENRNYYFLADKKGKYELWENETPDAEVLTVSTRTLASGLFLYQEEDERTLPGKGKVFRISENVFLGSAVVVLVILWFVVDYFHKRG